MTETPPELLEAVRWLMEPEGAWQRGAPSWTNWYLRGFPDGFYREARLQPWAVVRQSESHEGHYLYAEDPEALLCWLVAERVITEEDRQLLLVELTLGLSNGF